MPFHHPGTYVHHHAGLTNVPWVLTTHLLSINYEQLLRATRHPFLSRAANGTLPKSLVASWLANDLMYLEGYTKLNSDLLNQVRLKTQASVESDIETRLLAWLEAGVQNGKREINLFHEVAEIYQIDVSTSALPEHLKLEGLRRYEVLFANAAAQQPNAFIPWLEGVTLLWATEKVYYEAWRWARRQDAQSSPRTFENDEDGGAMRREFIPNWSNRDFLVFIEQLERILNEGVSQAVNKDEARWAEVKARTQAIWTTVLDAEVAFWPDVPETTSQPKATGDGVKGEVQNGHILA
ncbi:heme oxygenase-like protein [Cucurbitaria berberidis CBS 394.84]|uniref:Heme oxygenase-like protein n=1 Tax=Cucurbitaria berberidis CBS 394.84 TaxID=1168544 RepID=A0A9P4GSS3_9PLEO|nr:heme oxygenase-like protein [Cucurbitaria berberidis CBS 394.84]KAF1851070.1 heme oxygenase-like protein [Cucurbitaria berberidis CBS 394.84]